MKTPKQRFKPIIITSREAMTATVNDYARTKNEHARLTLQMEEEIAAAQKRYQERLDDLGRSMAAAEAGLQVWAQQHRDTEFPKDRKSIDLQLATIGFRDTPYRVEKCRSKDTWSEIALRMAAYREIEGEGDDVVVMFSGEDYVVYPEPELSKKLLLQDRARLAAGPLKAVGIRFDTDELFYIDLKSDVLEGVVKEAA